MLDMSYEVSGAEALKNYENLCQHVTEFVNLATVETVDTFGPQVLHDFRQEPPPIKTPVHWTSPAQKRYVMMMKKKGLIPSPYVRSHVLSQGWTLTTVFDPGKETGVELTNPVGYATYVVGLRQQQWHAETGWFNVADKANYWALMLIGELVATIVRNFVATANNPIGATNA